MKDIHKEHAKQLFGVEQPTEEMRRIAKAVYFVDMYRGDPMNIQIALHRGDVFLSNDF